MNVSVQELRLLVAALRFCIQNQANPLVKAAVFASDEDVVDAIELVAELKHTLQVALERMPRIPVEVSETEDADAE